MSKLPLTIFSLFLADNEINIDLLSYSITFHSKNLTRNEIWWMNIVNARRILIKRHWSVLWFRHLTNNWTDSSIKFQVWDKILQSESSRSKDEMKYQNFQKTIECSRKLQLFRETTINLEKFQLIVQDEWEETDFKHVIQFSDRNKKHI